MTTVDGITAHSTAFSDRYRRLFGSVGQLNRLLRLAAWRTGERWITVWMPRRWDPRYAASLGYQRKKAHAFAFAGIQPENALPFFHSGQWMTEALGASPQVTATKGRVRLRILVPVGHPLRPDTARVFKRIPSYERTDLVGAFDDALTDLLGQTESITGGRSSGLLRLNKASRSAAKDVTGRDRRADLPMDFARGMLAQRDRQKAIRADWRQRADDFWMGTSEYWRTDTHRREQAIRRRSSARIRQARRRTRLRTALASAT